MTKYRKLSFMDFPDYKIGTDGSVWSRKVPRSKNKKGPWRKLKPLPAKSGHLRIHLCNSDGVVKVQVHTLVLLAFKGKPKPGQEACHYPDRNPANNNIDNLSWGSTKRNQRHRFKHGTDCCGTRSTTAKLTWKKVRKIRRLYGTMSEKTGLVWTQVRLGKRYNVAYTTVQWIVQNKTWVERTNGERASSRRSVL